MKNIMLIFAFLWCGLLFSQPQYKKTMTPTPPMGWNSWDCLGMDANEKNIKEIADYMAVNLKKYGWKYVVIDAGWYHPKEITTVKARTYHPIQNIDKYGRLVPDTIKFPSAKGGKGFRPLADYIHSKGLKFGIHVQRGVPWNAVYYNTPIENSLYSAGGIANLTDTCEWSPIMKGVDMNKPGAQDYENSLYRLYASWGVDFVKVDDMCRPYHKAEIEAVAKAINQAKADIIYSLSPGEPPIKEWKHLSENANIWRISDDFWDDWKYLKRQFEICHKWDFFKKNGTWPDNDMLPLGKLRLTGGDAWIASQLGSTISEVTNEYSRFTDTEKYTLMTLWCMFKSPLFLGGYVPENDSVTNRLITNQEVIDIDQRSVGNCQLRNQNGIVIRVAFDPKSKSKYVAMFNLNDDRKQEITITWKELGISGKKIVRNLWQKKDLGYFSEKFSMNVDPHGCALVKIGR